MINPHYKETKKRILESNAKYILAIQDQMRLNFSHHKAKTDLGGIGRTTSKTEQYGLIQHSVLCVTDQNEPLGLMDLKYFDYSEFDVSIGRDKRVVEEKTNIMWLDALKRMRQRLGRVLNLKPLIEQICRFVNYFCSSLHQSLILI